MKQESELKPQYQKRYLVSQFSVRALATETFSEIHDGYWETSPGCINRVRVCVEHTEDGLGDITSTLTTKRGTGAVRRFEEHKIDTTTANILLKTCPYRLQKARRCIDGWKLDLFIGVLDNLALAEIDVSDPNDNPKLPHWISEAREITSELSNYHLARLGSDLTGMQNELPFEQLLARIPKIVITGGPCSGKSTVMRAIENDTRLSRLIHCVPEVASIVISQVGVRPPVDNPVAYRKFQRTIYTVQTGFEEVSETQALADGKRAVVTDRGVMDNAAYLHESILELELLCRTDAEYELARYDLVIHLAVPDKATYDTHCRNNPARKESWEGANELDFSIGEAWNSHHRYIRFANRVSMQDKIGEVKHCISMFLEIQESKLTL